jgi:hypothetical protein
MNKLVVHHTYINGMAFDTSNNRNHGIPYSVTQAGPPFAPSFDFAVPDSRVIVRPSPSLQDLIAVRAIVIFSLNAAGGLTRRYNLIEGHLSFALFVQPDGSLMGTILDSTGNWTGAQSAPNLVKSGSWHQAEIRHDGINQCVVLLDGITVGTSYAGPGPVRSVGPHGIAIGHWPETPGVYTFEGHIRETYVYKYDPLQAAKGLLNSCCVNRPALDQVADELRKKGYTADQAYQQGMELLNFGIAVTNKVRGSDQAVSQKHASLSALALGGFLRGDSASYNTAIAQLAALSASRLSSVDEQQIRADEERLLKSLPLPLKAWQELLGNLCWDRATINPKDLRTEFGQFSKQASRSKTR